MARNWNLSLVASFRLVPFAGFCRRQTPPPTPLMFRGLNVQLHCGLLPSDFQSRLHTRVAKFGGTKAHVNVQTTLAADIRMVRFFFRLCAAQFGLDLDGVRGLNLSTLGVAPPQAGLALKITRAHRQWVSRELRAFCLGRPIRSANDLARPFRHQS